MSEKKDGGRPNAHERLRRLLFVVPFVSRNPGRTVDEVAQSLGVSREELLEDLDLLTMVGRPPFQPDDFIDIYVEEGRVFVDLDQRLSAPPRLTAAEGVALASAAALLKPGAGDALTKALQKLEQVLPTQAVARFRDMGRQLDVALEAPSGMSVLTQAIVEHRKVAFDYFTAGRGQTEGREVLPQELLSHRGQWYLSGYCLTRREPRLFRLDRMAQVTLTGEYFTAGGDGATVRQVPDERQGEVVVRFSPRAAPYARERFGASALATPDGGLEVTVPGDSERWLTRWVISFGGDATVITPDWAVKAVARAAHASLESA